MIYTEQAGTFSEAANLLLRLLHATIALNLMLRGLGPGDTRNLFDVVTYCRIANIKAVSISPNFFRAEAFFPANSSHSAGEICAL